MNTDWAILCPFMVVVFNTKQTPQRIELILLRPTRILSADPRPEAKPIGAAIEPRISDAIKGAMGLP